MNQSCLENLFCLIRGKDTRNNPNACEFISALHQVMVVIILFSSENKNFMDAVDIYFPSPTDILFLI